MLRRGYSINLYMFHGGTSFGFMSGANWDHHNYEPDVTSYDYDSPLTESGAPTKKYLAFRDVIAKYRPGTNPPDLPSPLPVIEIPEFGLDKVAGLWANLPQSFPVDHPRNMEEFGQSYSYILYRTTLKSSASGALVLPALRSYARVYLNGKLIGVAGRRKKQDRVELEGSANDQLDILVEATGRINFTRELRNERHGLNGRASLAGQELSGWRAFPLPMDDFSKLNFTSVEPRMDSAGPAFYQGHFDLQILGDTFLDTAGWANGAVWINGHALGRFWNQGPQQTLCVPAPWLRKGSNEVVVFALEAHSLRLRGLREPILNEVASE